MMLLAGLLLAMSANTDIPPGTYADLPPDLAKAAIGYDEAQIRGSRAELQRWLADDYLLVNSSGQRETKAQLISDYTTPGYSLEPFTIEQPVHKVWTDGAILGGLVTVRGMDSGKRYEARVNFADVWVKRNGRWQVIYTQVGKAK
jgi:hypothetical protein